MKIVTVLGTRPEIIKLSSLIPLLDENFDHVLVHTGQHYSYKLDQIFFEQLELREPNYTLDVGSKTHVKQTAQIMIKLEPILLKEKPDIVVVLGDTNSTLAGALSAAKAQIPLAHVEAGCRSFNPLMPEETNRVLTDHCASLLFAPDKDSYENLVREGIGKKQIFLVGSTLTDACLRNWKFARSSDILDQLGPKRNQYVLVTLHRAENTDNPRTLQEIIKGLNGVAERIGVVFPIHPRTKEAMRLNKIKASRRIQIVEPVGYLDFLKLLSNALFVMTDSGGMQEEAAVLNTPALILRTETEWVDYVRAGKNLLIGIKSAQIVREVNSLLTQPKQLTKMREIKIKLSRGVSKKIVQILKLRLPA